MNKLHHSNIERLSN